MLQAYFWGTTKQSARLGLRRAHRSRGWSGSNEDCERSFITTVRANHTVAGWRQTCWPNFWLFFFYIVVKAQNRAAGDFFSLCAILDLRLSLDNSDADRRPSSWNSSHLSWHSARKTTHSRFHLILTILPLLLPLCLNTQIWPSALCDVTKGNNTTSQQSRCRLCLFFMSPFPTSGRSRKASVLAGSEKTRLFSRRLQTQG